MAVVLSCEAKLEKWLVGKGVPQEEADDLAHRAGLAWPAGIAGIGFFALHTTAAAICGVHFGPWLLSRWYAWIKPLSGMSSHTLTGNDWLQNFELTSVVPALVVGYLLSRYSARLATYAWVLPTAVLGYKLLTFTEPQASVLAPQASMRWEYFFVIQRTMPTFFAGSDPIRVAEQINVVAPFYAGLAYSTGAIAETRDLVNRFFGNSRMQPETETAGWRTESMPTKTQNVDASGNENIARNETHGDGSLRLVADPVFPKSLCQNPTWLTMASRKTRSLSI